MLNIIFGNTTFFFFLQTGKRIHFQNFIKKYMQVKSTFEIKNKKLKNKKIKKLENTMYFGKLYY